MTQQANLQLAGVARPSALDHPLRVSLRGWWHIVRGAWREAKADNVGLLAAGVAFYGFLALFPALIAAILVYGLVADPEDVQRQVDAVADVLPADAQSVISRQLNSIVTASNGALGLGLVLALAGALWTASAAVQGLIKATNTAYDARETRRTIKLRAIALLLTVGAIVFVLAAVFLVAAVPAIADAIGVGTVGRIATEVIRWPLLVGAVMAALAIVYWIAPDRESARLRWISVGSVVAALVWIAASIGFSVYVNNFGRYGATYGSLAGVVVLMLWLYVSAYIVLLGAEVNAEAERHEADRRGAAVPGTAHRPASATDTG